MLEVSLRAELSTKYAFNFFVTFDSLFVQVLNGPEPSRPRPRPRPTKTRQSALNSAAVRARYGMSEATLDAHRAASAERRKSTVYGDSAAMAKIRDAVNSGVKTAQDTGITFLKVRYLLDN